MEFDRNMLAYCGLYCLQCSFKAAYEENDLSHLESLPPRLAPVEPVDLAQYNCECCKGHSICGPCKIRPCASAKNIDSCADCESFPCDYTNTFASDGLPHHFEAVQNLKHIRSHGAEQWFESLRPRLACHCGQRQTWYYKCPQHSQ